MSAKRSGKTGKPGKTPLVSVLVPVFNGEKYLSACLDSVFGQSLRNIEVICADDGSTDGTAKILSEYAAREPRLRVVTAAENGGLPSARNLAFAEARGRYAYFFDADDLLPEGALKRLTEVMEEDALDGVLFETSPIFEDEEMRARFENDRFYRRKNTYEGVFTGPKLYIETLTRGDYIPMTWLEMWRTDFLRREGLRFCTDLDRKDDQEDDLFYYQAMLRAKRVRCLKEPLHRYRRHAASITAEDRGVSLHARVVVYCERVRALGEAELPPDLREIYEKYMFADYQEIARLYDILGDIGVDAFQNPSHRLFYRALCQSKSEAKAATEKPQKNYVSFAPGPVSLETGLSGVKLDFNYGARVLIPEGNYHVRFTDLGTSSILYDADVSNALVTSTKKYYIPFRVEVWKDGQLALTHDLDLKGRNVHIRFPVGTLGDILAWFPYAEEFRKKHGCRVYCSMSGKIAALLRPGYPNIEFITPGTAPEDCYATYYMGIFFPADDRFHQPVDHRIVGLQKTIPYILGLDVVERRPLLTPSKKRPIREPYVCIAAQATSQAKYWNNPRGWIETVDFLKALGYRVLCIDKEKCHGYGRHWNTIPYGAEDFTGDRPLQERVDFLGHADFFVGLGSGLSWLAWGSGVPVVMISGFSLPHSEFYTPYRVINFHVCNGCWTDSSEEFVHADFGWCPRHENTEREFECTRFISSGQVCQTIARLMQDYDLDPEQGHRRKGNGRK